MVKTGCDKMTLFEVVSQLLNLSVNGKIRLYGTLEKNVTYKELYNLCKDGISAGLNKTPYLGEIYLKDNKFWYFIITPWVDNITGQIEYDYTIPDTQEENFFLWWKYEGKYINSGNTVRKDWEEW